MEFAKAKSEEDIAEGLMLKMSLRLQVPIWGTQSYLCACRHCGRRVSGQEADDTRLYTHGVRVNHRIRCRDKICAPGAWEKKQLLREMIEAKQVAFSVVGDIAKAHRRFKHRVEEHGYLGCQIDTSKDIPAMGTFGVSCASYWWTRISAAGRRATHHLLGPEFMLALLLYEDDLESLGVGPAGRKGIPPSYCFMSLLGFPFKWAKTRGGLARHGDGIQRLPLRLTPDRCWPGICPRVWDG